MKQKYLSIILSIVAGVVFGLVLTFALNAHSSELSSLRLVVDWGGTFNNKSATSTEKVIITNAGKVGIGTTPGYKLDVAGDINLTGVLGVGTATPNSARNINSAITRADANGYGIFNSVSVGGVLTAARTNYGTYNLITSTADNTNFSNNLYANWNQVTNADGTGYNAAYGSYNYILNNDTALTNTTSVGNIGYVLNNATGALTNAYGTQGQVINNTTGAIANARGVFGYVRNDDGTMTNAYGVVGQTYQNVAGGTITNAYGGYFNVGQTAGAITTGYGVYIGNTGGANQYGLYQAGSDDTNYFAGKVGIGLMGPGEKLSVAGNVMIGNATWAAGTTTGDLAIQGNVGIGITDPGTRRLKVAGDMEVTGKIFGEGVVPSGFCVFSPSQTSCPAGWTRSSDFDTRTIRGSATPGTLGGSETHRHDYEDQAASRKSGGSTWMYINSQSNWPPYMDVLICCKN